MSEFSPQAEARDMQLAATRGSVPGGRLSKTPFRQPQNRLCSKMARSSSPCPRLSSAKSRYSSARAVSVVSSPASR